MGGIRIAIDRGGTFTDCIGTRGSGKAEDDTIIKLLSVDPKNYPDAPLEGIRRLLEIFRKKKIPRGHQLDISDVESIRMGTTLATNCVLERNGEKCALVTTRGFKDALLIRDQTRPKIFDLAIRRSDVLYDSVVEIDERVTLEDYAEDPANQKSVASPHNHTYTGRSGEVVRVINKPNEADIRSVLQMLYATGIRSIAVAFLHSYTFPEHELLVEDIARDIGFTHISLSSKVSPMIKFVPRANSSVVDAYLTPVIRAYLDSIESGLQNSENTNMQFMQSDGGLVNSRNFSGLKAILSGPAGGVVGYSATCYDSNKIPLIGFDMGGTSTDVSRFGEGKLEHVFETTTAGIIIQSSQLDINTVAAGGSSRLFWENGLFRVGPESAAAEPGPTAYRKGGPLTITDANLVLDRLIPEFFPKIFGPDEDQSLDLEASIEGFRKLAEQINQDLGTSMTIDEVAYGFIKVANESMARPIRALTEAKGHIVSHHRLVSFGGAGGQHAIAVAEALGISTVLIHRYSSILSAYGMLLADVVEEAQEPCSYSLTEANIAGILGPKFEELTKRTKDKLIQQGFASTQILFDKYLNLRYEGTETSLMVLQKNPESWQFEDWFAELHKREFGFVFPNKHIIVDDIRVRATGKSNTREEESIAYQLANLTKITVKDDKISFFNNVYFEGGRIKTPVYRIDDLLVGSVVKGPAILADGTQTNIIPPNAETTILNSHIYVEISSKINENIGSSDRIDPVLLSIFSHRFMDIAEQMGIQLKKTSVSTNVKERLDFSCALFDSYGNLVANAPHVPVHLGSMSTCIAAQAKLLEGKLKPGDVIITNHPDIGGTHLPDITIITPAFSSDNTEIVFYVASRAHHADIGGTLPGSIPPNSTELYEEGAAIYSELVVKSGVFDEALLKKLFYEDPAKYPGCSGSRCLSDNISDIKAQIAANNKGIQLINNLISDLGLDVVMTYMKAIQSNSSITVKKMFKKIVGHFGRNEFAHEDYMDDGSVIKLKISLNIEREEYLFDFNGTSPQVNGNLNAPIAITNSAILYCLRCLVDEEIPLNQGCLQPITVKIPEGTLLSPTKGVAVVGGNVMTSQRVTDVILKAFNVMADSQGDCNNFTFGTGGKDPITGEIQQGFGYYETIGGGHGAGGDSWRGIGWNGAHAVHTNMTNTRMTDVEILERRYPVILREFSIRHGSGGRGTYSGGNGITRDIEFRIPIQASILSERRVNQPHGLNGGEDGERGLNLWIRKDNGAIINIGGRGTVNANPGDRIIIQTPGGGGYGPPPHPTTKRSF
ncbi:5-oxoprolinase Ecym_6035 [Eremothecium cymbalariae DBVPG|uniref:5-oxoprolinase n=1 Tax=Eremothecium cymbalariae (strain CBS 270.75 / DBVPG 7215 / KCTC 17166 / NRRL Y-17582) TaxID=931890 RepID=G8JUW0_ERECY|nr:hypothetical protein Ecym_6035 [Eremothecium cymbalariae DBVPG\